MTYVLPFPSVAEVFGDAGFVCSSVSVEFPEGAEIGRVR